VGLRHGDLVYMQVRPGLTTHWHAAPHWASRYRLGEVLSPGYDFTCIMHSNKACKLEHENVFGRRSRCIACSAFKTISVVCLQPASGQEMLYMGDWFPTFPYTVSCLSPALPFSHLLAPCHTFGYLSLSGFCAKEGTGVKG
jgi:hypothetical protein